MPRHIGAGFRLLSFLLLCGRVLAQAPAARTSADLLAEGDRLRQRNEYDKALPFYEQSLQAARSEHDLAAEAAALLEIGDAERGRNNYDKARRALDECLAIRERLGNKADLGLTLNVIGNVEFAKGAHGEALSFYQRALKVREEAGDRGGVAGTTANIGAVYRVIGDYEAAIPYLARAEQDQKAMGREAGRSITLNNLAMVHAHLADYPRALQINAEQLAIVEKLDNRELIAAALNAKGIIENWCGDYRAALDAHDRALKIRQELGSRWGMAESLNNIGLVYQAQKDHPQAIDRFIQAIRICREIGNKSLEGDGHRNLGRELLAHGRAEEAIAEFELGYGLGEATGEKVNMGIALDGMGRANLQLGRNNGAVDAFKRAIELQASIGEKIDLAESKVDLSRVELQIGHPADALRIAREAADLASSIEAPEVLWQAKLASGRALEAIGSRSAAAAELDGAMETIESLRLHVAGPETDLSGYLADKLEPYRERMSLALLAGNVDEALVLAERSKARALAQILETGRLDIAKSMTEAERSREQELQSQLVALNLRARRESSGGSGTMGSKPSGATDIRVAIDRKRREWESFRTSLYAAHPELPEERAETAPLSLGEMQRLVRSAGAVILDYVVTPRATHLFVLPPGGSPREFTISIDAASLGRKTAELRREMASHELGFADMSREMYRLLLAPAAKLLRRHSGWIVVPDGALWDVPFQALQDGSGHYVIEGAAVSYVPSLRVLRETRREARRPHRATSGRDLLALGNPAVPGAEPLPEAERQVAEIGRLYGESSSRLATGRAASERLFKSEAGRYRVLHLAAHAVLEDGDPMYSHILLAAGEGEDGLLEARKIMDLDLKAEMLVLSACETARGTAPAGEGITGMLWAAFVAGAPTTVASLWRVESASTSELMIEFHRQWLASRRKGWTFAKAESLRTAARKLIASGKYAHPFYWAGFILAGSP